MTFAAYALPGHSSDPHALKSAAQDAMRQLDDQATALRSIIATLHPVTLRGLGLSPTIRALARRVADENGLRVTVGVKGEDEAASPGPKRVGTACGACAGGVRCMAARSWRPPPRTGARSYEPPCRCGDAPDTTATG